MTIKQNTYLNAAVTAKELSEKRINLTTRPSTPLGDLLDASVSFQSPKTTNAESILLRGTGTMGPVILRTPEFLAMDVASITANGDDQSYHSLKIAALAQDLAPYITAHISHARNVVSPLVVELAQKLEKFKENAKPLDPASAFTIIKASVPMLMLDESFIADGIEAYDGIEARVPEGIDIDAEITDEFIASLTNLGSDRLNELVADWLKTKDKDFVKNCYLVNFTTKSYGTISDTYEGYSLWDTNRSIYQNLDIGLACYLIAKRLFLEPQPVEGLSLVAYKEKIRSYMDFAGSLALKSAKTALRQQEAGTLVSEAIISKKRITVNNKLYQEWLSAGGCPEVLLGMLVSGQVQYSVSGTDSAKEQLLRHWNNYLMLAQADVRGEMMKRFRNYLEAEVILGLSELTESEKDYAQESVNLKDQIAVKVKEEIEHMSHRLMDDVYHTALHVIAKGRFYYTSAYQILNEMTQVAKQNPDIDVREAALLSVINYVAEYFVAQIQVEK